MPALADVVMAAASRLDNGDGFTLAELAADPQVITACVPQARLLSEVTVLAEAGWLRQRVRHPQPRWVLGRRPGC
jgi:hypothetical protein